MEVPQKRRAAEGMKTSIKAKTREYENLGNPTIVEEDDVFDTLLDLDNSDDDGDDEDESFHSNNDSDTDEDDFATHHTDHSVDANAKIYCVLYGLSCFDLVKSVSIDYMHCVLQGMCKLLGGGGRFRSAMPIPRKCFHYTPICP